MAQKVLVLILRRTTDDLLPEEITAVEHAYEGQDVVWKTTNPRDFKEHAADCKRLKPAAVLLPLERPIPSLAMEEGTQHIVILRDGAVKELEPLQPTFKEFHPKG